MDRQEILKKVDHTLLAQTATWEEIKEICDDAIKYQTASICIPPSYVKEAKAYVQDQMAVCTVIGFPNGYNTTAVKKAETEDDTLKDEIWLLKLLQKERDLELSAKIRVRRTGHPLVSQEDYEILSCFGRERTEISGIAVDHSCLILQALLYLKSELES